VATTAPHYPQSKIYPGFGQRLVDERMEGEVRVLRLRPWIVPGRALARRVLSELWTGMGLALMLVRARPTLVIATAPPLIFAPIAFLLTRVLGVRFVLDVRDLYWEYARDLGGRFGRALTDVARIGVLHAARGANLVITTNERQCDYFVRQGVEVERTHVALNGVDDDLLESLAPIPGESSAPVATSAVLSVAYVGLLGLVQGIGVLVEAAIRLPQSDWEFYVAGDGPERAAIASSIEGAGVRNVHLLGYLEANEVVRLLKDADVLYAQLRGVDASTSALPSKLFEYMAAGKPIVFGGVGASADLMREAGAGIVVAPDDADALARALSAMRDGDLRRQLGWSGREFAEGHRRTDLVAEFVHRVEAISR
jgi:glycosyltransferase involved in cell wall biosynthesis